jgi:mercuric ion transport protein
MTADAQSGRSRPPGDADPMTPGQAIADDAPMAGAVGRHALARLAFAAIAWLFVACLVVQVLLVGLDVFADLGGSIHRDFAYVYGWLTPVLVLLAGFAGAPRTTRNLTIVLVVLFAVQVVLPSLRDVLPLLAALHAVNALAIFAVAVMVAARATDLLRARSADRAAES